MESSGEDIIINMRRDEKSENMKDESQNDLEINIMSENFEHEKSRSHEGYNTVLF